MRGTDFVVPVGADNEQVFNFGMSEEVFDEAYRRGVEPLKVIQKKRQWVFFLSKYAKKPSEDCLEPVLGFLRRELRNRRLLTNDQFELRDKADDKLAVRSDGPLQNRSPMVHLVLVL